MLKTKAKKDDIVLHNGKDWRILEREYNDYSTQSYYLLKRGRRGSSTYETKWVRSDRFDMT